MDLALGPRGTVGRVRYISEDRQRIYLELMGGQTATATGQFPDEFAIGTVVLVTSDPANVEVAPNELWPEEEWVGVVRLKDEKTTIVDNMGRWRKVPTFNTVEYQQGNTVECTDSKGVTRVLSKTPLKLFDMGEIDDHFIAERFIHEPSAEAPETFDDFGGLKEVVERAQELITLSLNRRGELRAIGARPVKGVLFTGEAGVGKTMLARIIANSSGVKFYEISGPQVFSKWFGESEEILRKLFDHAERQQEGAIIFFDEIDSVAGHRSQEAHEESRRVVAQLLTLMDGFKSSTNVVVIAATNRPQDIDVALRRPGRFDWEIVFPRPSESDRVDILQKAAKRYKTVGPLSHLFVAAHTDGWSGAELTAIWTEAASLAVADERGQIVEEDYIGGFERVLVYRQRATALSSRGGSDSL